jgi:pimeloyl-ACP methyl ester carboxylesterase
MLDNFELTSPDGTRIGCYSSGTGPPLVLVHGTTGTHADFDFLSHLVEKFTLIAIDRRGCGKSGDAPDPYSIEREIEDVAAVVNSVGERVSLFGHSYGALVALGAAPLAPNLAKLVLYEPPLRVSTVSDLFLERLDDLARRGDLETLLTEFYNVDWIGLTPEQINEGRMTRDWGSKVAGAATILREIRAAREWNPNTKSYQEFTTPTLLLLGSESPEWGKQATKNATALIRDSRVVILQGQGHIATATAPELLATELAAFLGQ